MPTRDDSKEKRRRSIRTVVGYLARYKGGLAVGAVCLVLTDLLLLANPYILKIAIDNLSANLSRQQLFRYAAILVAVTLVSGVFRFLMRRIMIGISRKIELDMRNDFFAHLQALSPSFYDRRRTGDLMALATNDLNAVRTLVGPAVMYSLNTVVVASLTITLMFLLSWKLTVAALIPMLLLIVGVYNSVRIIHRLFEKVQQRFAAINSRAQENLSGIRVVKAYARERYEINRFEELSQDYVDQNMKLFRVQSVLNPLLTTIAGLGGLAILAVGGRLVITGAITLGTFVAFNGYLTMLIWPMIAIGWVMNITERGLASMQRMNEIFETRPAITDPTPDRRVAGERVTDHSIRFENVTFAYGSSGERTNVLRNVDFTIENGETVAIVGATGSGKSTIVKLLLRLYEPTEGRILIGGQPIDSLALEDLRRMIGLVPQDIFLFSDTIRENIGFGVPELDDTLLNSVATTAAVRDEILGFPKGYEAVLGERGINLSGGQKQRVAIARAMAKDPSILILDDALSSVDATTEENILRSMSAQMRKRTSVVISHRISTAREANRVIVLDDGAIADIGTHDELVERGGIYAEMFHKQMIMVNLEQR